MGLLCRMKNKKFIPQRRNANRHTQRGLRLLEQSLQSDGWIDAQTAAADGEIISGSARLEIAAEKFADVEPIIVESDGTRPVIVVRTDIPNTDDPRARRLSVAANKIASVDYDPDGELLKEWGSEDEKIQEMFSDGEWGVIEKAKNNYDTMPEQFAIMIFCENEDEQVHLLEELSARGLRCRALVS